MNVLILTAETAEAIIASQTGQHRLGPVALTDGRFFLSADVLEEELFASRMVGVEYQEAALDDVRHPLPVDEKDKEVE
jgi:hypothetical protein